MDGEAEFSPGGSRFEGKAENVCLSGKKRIPGREYPESDEVGICINLMKSRNKQRDFLLLIPAFSFICLTDI